jgi:hypothetical protein
VKVKELLNSEEKWCKGHFAMDAEGESVAIIPFTNPCGCEVDAIATADAF